MSLHLIEGKNWRGRLKLGPAIPPPSNEKPSHPEVHEITLFDMKPNSLFGEGGKVTGRIIDKSRIELTRSYFGVPDPPWIVEGLEINLNPLTRGRLRYIPDELD
ncbi:hypothetical protein HYS94_04425 [Candidatus Daviesbacteria bacterium]|nr:hypothetical protein [Candidatus Daviesbacteria bacterium]